MKKMVLLIQGSLKTGGNGAGGVASEPVEVDVSDEEEPEPGPEPTPNVDANPATRDSLSFL